MFPVPVSEHRTLGEAREDSLNLKFIHYGR